MFQSPFNNVLMMRNLKLKPLRKPSKSILPSWKKHKLNNNLNSHPQPYLLYYKRRSQRNLLLMKKPLCLVKMTNQYKMVLLTQKRKTRKVKKSLLRQQVKKLPQWREKSLYKRSVKLHRKVNKFKKLLPANPMLRVRSLITMWKK